MKPFAIITDSCSSLSKDERQKYNIDYVPMSVSYNGTTAPASLDWNVMSAHEFYDLMRNGTRVLTSQANAVDYKEKFLHYINQGYDILSISCSSALSASVKASYVVRDQLLAEHPDCQIVCIDSLNSSAGLGILCKMAANCRAEGKTLQQTADYIQSIRLCVNQECTVDKLLYLKQAGRVSPATALFGSLLNVKPIIISDVIGQNCSVEKVKGKKLAYQRLVERALDEYDPTLYSEVVVAHADCIEDANMLISMLVEKRPELQSKITVAIVDPIVGASAGPGTVAIYVAGKPVTFDSSK